MYKRQEQVSEGWSAFLTGLPLGQWYFDEASTWFFLMAVLIGIIGGLSEQQIVNTFITGAADMLSLIHIYPGLARLHAPRHGLHPDRRR